MLRAAAADIYISITRTNNNPAETSVLKFSRRGSRITKKQLVNVDTKQIPFKSLCKVLSHLQKSGTPVFCFV